MTTIDAPTPTEAQTLLALRVFGRRLLNENMCSPTRAECVYLAPELRGAGDADERQEYARRFALETVSPPSFLNDVLWRRQCEKLPRYVSDSYVCYGSDSTGSGRAVFVGDTQLKGVGRTVNAGVQRFYKDACGAYPFVEALRELLVTRLLEQVLAVPPIGVDFILLHRRRGRESRFRTESDPAGSLGSIMGRRGSPLRHAHVDYLLGCLNDLPEVEAIVLWRKFVNRCLGRSGWDLSAAQLESFFLRVLANALSLVADVRLFGLDLANWRDNSDVFSRVFDLGDVRSTFPLAPRGGARARAATGESPCVYFRRWQDCIPAPDYHHALNPLVQALRTLELICERAGYERRALHALFSWSRIERGYESALRRTLSRVLGTTADAIRGGPPVASVWPLWRKDRRAPHALNWEDVAAAFSRGCSGSPRRARSGETAFFEALGARARRARGFDPRAARVAAERVTRVLSEPRDRRSFAAVERIARAIERAMLRGRHPDSAELEAAIERVVGPQLRMRVNG